MFVVQIQSLYFAMWVGSGEKRWGFGMDTRVVNMALLRGGANLTILGIVKHEAERGVRGKIASLGRPA